MVGLITLPRGPAPGFILVTNNIRRVLRSTAPDASVRVGCCIFMYCVLFPAFDTYVP